MEEDTICSPWSTEEAAEEKPKLGVRYRMMEEDGGRLRPKWTKVKKLDQKLGMQVIVNFK